MPPELPRTVWTWARLLWSMSEQDILRFVGADAYMFLRFLRMATKVSRYSQSHICTSLGAAVGGLGVGCVLMCPCSSCVLCALADVYVCVSLCVLCYR